MILLKAPQSTDIPPHVLSWSLTCTLYLHYYLYETSKCNKFLKTSINPFPSGGKTYEVRQKHASIEYVMTHKEGGNLDVSATNTRVHSYLHASTGVLIWVIALWWQVNPYAVPQSEIILIYWTEEVACNRSFLGMECCYSDFQLFISVSMNSIMYTVSLKTPLKNALKRLSTNVLHRRLLSVKVQDLYDYHEFGLGAKQHRLLAVNPVSK